MVVPLPFDHLQAYEWLDTPFWVYDLHHRKMVWANGAGVRFWDAESLEDLLKRDFSELSESTLTRLQTVMADHVKGLTTRDQWTLYPKGKPVTVIAHGNGVLLPNGIVGILYEGLVAQQKFEPGVLRGIEAMQHTSVHISLYALDGRCLMRNPAAAAAFGPVIPEDANDDFAALFKTRGEADEIHEIVRTGRLFSSQLQLRTKNGLTWYGMDARCVRDPVTGEHAILINARDISDLKHVENELRFAKDAAEAANVAKSQFLAMMSHEIRTPMNGILGMAQLLLTPRVSEEERREYTGTILSSGQTLMTLLNDILDLSKVEAGKLELSYAVVNPPQLLKETASLFAELAQSKGLKIEAVWHGSESQCFRSDPIRLRQMLSNLVSNAIKFTESGFVRMEASEIKRNDTDALLEFSVTDSGIGIPQEKQSLLFKPFSQTDSSTTREYGGTGLGLSIVHSLAKLMGGETGVESEEGKRTRVWFRIHADLLQDAQGNRHVERLLNSTERSTESATKLTGHVLVVEDNLVNRKVIEGLLRKFGIRSESVENGQQAIDAITQGMRPDLVLMDIQMPILDGLSATKRIRQWEKETHQPPLTIVALTAGAFNNERQLCVGAGMDDFLAKPIEVTALKLALEKWLPSAQGARPEMAETSRTQKTLDIHQLGALLDEITPMLKQHKFNGVTRFKELQILVAGTNLEATFKEVGEKLALFQFDLALACLRRITSTTNWEDGA